MAISVLNTDAGLSGKTIVNLEDAQTVTGLKTFDRDPNAPFAVSAGSAVVPNLDADKLDGLEASAFAKLGTANAGNLIFTDATYDIGASGATRPRDLFLSRNATIGGTLGVTGIATFTATPVFSSNATVTGRVTTAGVTSSNTLLFTADNTHDIGASGATRPRDLFLGRNATIGGTLGVTGATTLTSLHATGAVRFGTFTASAPIGSVDGWIEITDAAGNVRKLGVVT
jgi:hypothetical protein